PGLNERLQAIRLFALHCSVLESWLATGRVVDEIPAQIDKTANTYGAASNSPLRSRWDPVVDPDTKRLVGGGSSSPIRATVLQTAHGLLILPVWYEPGAQCVPGPQSAE